MLKQTHLLHGGCDYKKEMQDQLQWLQEQGYVTPTLQWILNKLKHIPNENLGHLIDSKFWVRCLCNNPFSIGTCLFFFCAMALQGKETEKKKAGLVSRALDELQMIKTCCRTRLLGWTSEPSYQFSTSCPIPIKMLTHIPWKPRNWISDQENVEKKISSLLETAELPLSLFVVLTFASFRNVPCQGYAYAGHYIVEERMAMDFQEQMKRFRRECHLYPRNKKITLEQIKQEEEESRQMHGFRGYCLTFESQGEWMFLIWARDDPTAHVFMFSSLESDHAHRIKREIIGGSFYHRTLAPFHDVKMYNCRMDKSTFVLFFYAHMFVSEQYTISQLVTFIEENKQGLPGKLIRRHKEALCDTLLIRYKILQVDKKRITWEHLVSLFLEMTPLTNHTYFMKQAIFAFYKRLPPTHLFARQ